MARYPRPADRQIKLSTGTWWVRFVRRKDLGKKLYGLCDWNTKTIFVRFDLARLTVIDTLLHEIAHASNEILYEAESFVTDLATVGARTVLEILDEMNDNRSSTGGHSAS